MTDYTDDEKLAALARLQARGGEIELKFSPIQAWQIFAQLQLALRHPQNIGTPADFARTVAKRLQGAFAGIDPVLAELAEQGWNPAFDKPPETGL